MRILQVNKFYDPRGGTERVLFDLEDGLLERGHEVGVFAGLHPDNRAPAGRGWFVPGRDYANPGLRERVGHAIGTIYDRAARRAFAEALDEFCPDVVHLHNIYHQFSPSLLDELHDRRLPAVMTIHDFKLVCPVYRLYRDGELCEECVGRDFPLGVVRHRCSRGSLAESVLLAVESSLHRRRASYQRSLDRFVAPSEFMAAKLVEGGMPAERVVVARNAPRSVPAAPAAPSARAPGPRLLYAGRLSAEKGVELVVRAARECPSVALRIAGAGPEEESLRALAAGQGNVEFLGHLPPARLEEERALAWATLVPSRWYENAPMSVIESWWSGRPVLGSGHGGLAEMLGDGEAGWAIEPRQEAWVQALRRVGAGGDELARLGAQARARAEREHSFATLLDRMVGIYADAIREMGPDA